MNTKFSVPFCLLICLIGAVRVTAQSPAESPQQRAERILDEETVAEYRDTPLQHILGDLSKRHRLSIVLTPEATIRGSGLLDPDALTTLELRDISLRSLLSFVFDRHDLDYRVSGKGLIEIVPATKELSTARRESTPQRKARERLTKEIKDKRIALEFRDSDLNDLVTYLSDESGLLIKFDEKAIFDMKVNTEESSISVWLPEMSLDQCLRAVLTPFRLRAIPRHEMLLITGRDPKEMEDPSAEVTRALAQKLDLNVASGSLLSIAYHWSKETKVPVVVDCPAYRAAEIDPDSVFKIDVERSTLADALQQLKLPRPHQAIHRDGVILVTPTKR